MNLREVRRLRAFLSKNGHPVNSFSALEKCVNDIRRYEGCKVICARFADLYFEAITEHDYLVNKPEIMSFNITTRTGGPIKTGPFRRSAKLEYDRYIRDDGTWEDLPCEYEKAMKITKDAVNIYTSKVREATTALGETIEYYHRYFDEDGNVNIKKTKTK